MPGGRTRRSHDGKTTILQEIVKELCARDHPVLSEEMDHVVSSQVKVSLQEASDMAGQVEGSINQIRQQLKMAVPAVNVEFKVRGMQGGCQQNTTCLQNSACRACQGRQCSAGSVSMGRCGQVAVCTLCGCGSDGVVVS